MRGVVWLLWVAGCDIQAVAPVPPVPAAPSRVVAPASEVPAAEGTASAVPAAVASTDPVVAGLAAHPLDYTHHAQCRMDCRHITAADIENTLTKGTRDPSRSRDDGRCPSHALEAQMADGRELRVVFAGCADETRVVTAIDLSRDWPCACD